MFVIIMQNEGHGVRIKSFENCSSEDDPAHIIGKLAESYLLKVADLIENNGTWKEKTNADT